MLVIVAVLLASPWASAAPPLVVLPGADAPPPPLGQAPGSSAISLTDAWKMVREARAREALDRARKAVEVGRRAVAQLRLEQAEAALHEALGHFAAAQRLPKACSGAHDAARDLSFLFWQRKKLAAARRWRAAAAALTATAADPTRYPPEFLAFWSASNLNPAPIPVTIALKGPTDDGAAAAEAWVNCKAVGRAPAAAPVVGAALIAIARGSRTAGRVIAPDRSELYELALPAPGTDLLSDEDAAALLRASGAPALLWVKRAGPQGWVIDRFALKGGWQRPFRRISAAPAPPASDRKPGATARSEGSSPALGWALSATAAAALVSGVVTAVLADAAADEIENKARAEEVFDPADETDNRRYRAASYATLAVGGALATAAVVYWIWRARRQEARPTAGLELRGAGLVLRW